MRWQGRDLRNTGEARRCDNMFSVHELGRNKMSGKKFAAEQNAQMDSTARRDTRNDVVVVWCGHELCMA